LPLSSFYAVLIEVFAVFLAPGLLQGPFRFWATVQRPIGRSFLLGLAPLGPLAFSAEIDQITHALFRLAGSHSTDAAVFDPCGFKHRYDGADGGNRQ
jgi:hypothetical protein